MMEFFLARPWDEVRLKLIEQGIPFSCTLTEAPNRPAGTDRCRVARVRKTEEGWEFILTREKVKT